MLFGLAVIAIGLRGLWPDREDRPAAERALATALERFDAGNPSGAQAAAGEAVSADPNWGLAHAVLARMQLAQGDGLAAGASLDRASAAGFDMRRVRQLRAHALLLTGDLPRARAELSAADPRYAAYSDLVRAELALSDGNFARATEILQRAVAARPSDALAWTALARTRRAAADLRGAIVASERAVALDPRSTDALTLRGELVRTQYGLNAALPWFERALDSDPRNRGALIEYAATLGEVGHTRDMLAALRRTKGSPQAIYLQAVLAARVRKFNLARDILEHADGAIDDMPGVLLLRGILDLEAGDAGQASLYFRALLSRQPMNLTARRLLALAYARSDASRNAIGVLTPLIGRADADSYALTLAARAYERIGDRTRAAPFLDRAASPARGAGSAFSPDDSLPNLRAAADGSPLATIALIRGLLATGGSVEALARARALAVAQPGVPEAQTLMGDLWMLANRPADAATAFTRAAQLRFDEPAAMKLVEALGRAGRRDEAADTLALFLSQNPSNPTALRLSADWQLGAREYGPAAGSLEELRLRLGDRDAAALGALAIAYAEPDNARAIDFARAAYALQPSNPAVVQAYVTALTAAGDTNGAGDLSRKAASLAR